MSISGQNLTNHFAYQSITKAEMVIRELQEDIEYLQDIADCERPGKFYNNITNRFCNTVFCLNYIEFWYLCCILTY